MRGMWFLMANTKEDVNINKMYASESKISKDEFIQKYKIAENGITNEEAEEKFRRLGPNEIRQNLKSGTTIFGKVWSHHLIAY